MLTTLTHEEYNNLDVKLLVVLWAYCTSFKVVIDCRSTHSFLSLGCVRKLDLRELPTREMTLELASGKEIHFNTCVDNLTFKLATK